MEREAQEWMVYHVTDAFGPKSTASIMYPGGLGVFNVPFVPSLQNGEALRWRLVTLVLKDSNIQGLSRT